jgi:hypothetical protein
MAFRPTPICRCGHVKTIHRNLNRRTKKARAPRDCNFPDCKCKSYKPDPTRPSKPRS